MPSYEMVLLLKNLPIHELRTSLKRTASVIWEIGGVIRKIENLGFQKTPYKIVAPNKQGSFREAHYFLYHFHTSDMKMTIFQDALRRDLNVIRHRIFFVADPLELSRKAEEPECDIYIDRLPVPERPHVKEMVKVSKRKDKFLSFGIRRDYNPLMF